MSCSLPSDLRAGCSVQQFWGTSQGTCITRWFLILYAPSWRRSHLVPCAMTSATSLINIGCHIAYTFTAIHSLGHVGAQDVLTDCCCGHVPANNEEGMWEHLGWSSQMISMTASQKLHHPSFASVNGYHQGVQSSISGPSSCCNCGMLPSWPAACFVEATTDQAHGNHPYSCSSWSRLVDRISHSFKLMIHSGFRSQGCALSS